MIFRAVSYRIAAQFTAFVLAMLLLTGAVFLTADIANRGRMNRDRLERLVTEISERGEDFGTLPALPPFQRARIRIVSPAGEPLFSGELYEGIPFSAGERLATIVTGRDEFEVLTVPVERDGVMVGYIQVADRAPPHDLPIRVILYLAITALLSGLTFVVGLFFARRSLRPAEETMARLEQFTQDASHELRTPLTAVGTSLDLALLKPDNHDQIRAAKKDLKEMGLLVERLLELARLDGVVLSREDVDLGAMAAEVVARHQAPAAAKSLVIEVKTTRATTVAADPALLRQVLENLVGNAVKFNTAGGSVLVQVGEESVVVHNTGQGIAPEAIDRIFDRFFQEDAARARGREGLGLGLALVKRIVDLHGWTISVESSPQSGTTFTVRF